MLSRNAVIEFQKLYQEDLCIKLTYKEASIRAEKFLRLFKIVSQPIPRNWQEKQPKKLDN